MRILIGLLLLLSGCQSLQQSLQQQGYLQLSCAGSALRLADDACSQLAWLDYWQQSAQLDWPTRKAMIAKLGEQPEERLQAIILSQPSDTPYQSRLRAQQSMQTLIKSLPPQLATKLDLLIYQNAQKMLEYESALVTLGKLNARQAATLSEQDSQLTEQQAQLDAMHAQIQALLKLEQRLTSQEVTNEQ
ncbi:hypothetical protein [Bowmanella sp. JS7-9]|uniref:YfhG lipoprotein n=1 Tax=Pseudobowmanella zhangzhouensis TaxID=1537679 RepID=A0ABW1XKK1_9ALTE|nr:hypothetical protein [Bowmanella sp. JS7-9]